ncbi:MAG: polysaccharide biosynthesis protein [Clostridia bacterium]|nr:polysaccharide biosynthesis protein [Clostridia bacterium]
MRKLKKCLALSLVDLFSLFLAWLFAHAATGGSFATLLDKPLGIAFVVAAAALSFIFWGLYRLPLHNAGFHEMLHLLAAILSALIPSMIVGALTGQMTVPQVIVIFGIFFNLTALSRFSFRFLGALRYRFSGRQGKIAVMVIGGGDAGAMMIREMQQSDKVKYLPLCVIDDDPQKKGTTVCGVPVVGARGAIEAMVEKYEIEQIFVAIPTARGKDIGEICEICARTGRKVRVLPGIYEVLEGQATIGHMRDIDINDLLGRDPIRINNRDVFAYIEGKSILVTGGGGSIGSELCRQIAAHNPACLTIFDIYENNAYDIEMELRRKYPQLSLRVLIGSVRDEVRVSQVFEAVRPDIVFHAAAHKHVPLMETSPAEAVKNNVFGTYNVARAADAFGVERFVMISTDKAVNPTNVMGATKRICEMIVQYFATRSEKTDYVAVRFGNVLGSNGSVIPLFKKQIAAGGPVTVTHKDIIRYFMTIPEAVSLVLQAGAYATGGEIFVLDMGEPVKIVTLAENLIRLSGYRPYQDIDIQFTGLRPGEKLFEELLMNEEGMRTTPNKMIYIGKPIHFDEAVLLDTLDEMREAAREDNPALLSMIKTLVPTYHIDDCHSVKISKSEGDKQ